MQRFCFLGGGGVIRCDDRTQARTGLISIMLLQQHGKSRLYCSLEVVFCWRAVRNVASIWILSTGSPAVCVDVKNNGVRSIRAGP